MAEPAAILGRIGGKCKGIEAGVTTCRPLDCRWAGGSPTLGWLLGVGCKALAGCLLSEAVQLVDDFRASEIGSVLVGYQTPGGKLFAEKCADRPNRSHLAVDISLRCKLAQISIDGLCPSSVQSKITPRRPSVLSASMLYTSGA